MEALNEALALLRDPHVRYKEVGSDARRLFNQALFDRLFIRDGDIADATLTPWAEAIHDLAGTQQAHKEGRIRRRAQAMDPDPLFGARVSIRPRWCGRRDSNPQGLAPTSS